MTYVLCVQINLQFHRSGMHFSVSVYGRLHGSLANYFSIFKCSAFSLLFSFLLVQSG